MINLQEARRRAALMGAHVNWLRQKSEAVAPKAHVSVAPVVQKPVVVETPVQPAAPVETAAVVPELPTPSEPDQPNVDQLKEFDKERLISIWNEWKQVGGNELINKEIFRRARKFAKKNKLELPEGVCEGDNVQKFIDVLNTEIAPAE